MRPRFYTIGMAGHVDHGKTTLTKALTGVDTDRLKEEKERQISIELGYAPFPLDDHHVSIVDVPGHEKFIRQMIAGVAGIDLVVFVVAADEGVMPQTREHLEILSLLGITHGIIAITKVGKVESVHLELIEDDVRAAVKGTPFQESPTIFVDSLMGTGLDKLKSEIRKCLTKIPERNVGGAFRLPIDQVFTVQGHGTIVRGTVYEGSVETGAWLTVLPQNKAVKVREIQFHGQAQSRAVAGGRAAMKISGLSKEEIRRGDVLVASLADFQPSDTIDLSLHTVQGLLHPVKQRTRVKFHSGTAEVMGKIVFFDRNEASRGEEVLCQIRLDEPVVLRRGDRFVIRRPSPAYTIGGGWVISPFGGKYRFGEKTIQELERKRDGSSEERVLDAIDSQLLLTKTEMSRLTSLSDDSLEGVLIRMKHDDKVLELDSGCYTSVMVYNKVKDLIFEQLAHYHETFPMRDGINKAECIQVLERTVPRKLAVLVMENEVGTGHLVKRKQYICQADFEPHFPSQWKIRMEHVMERLKLDGLGTQPWEEYLSAEKIPEEIRVEMKHYVLQNQLAYLLDEKHLIHRDVVNSQLFMLHHGTNGQSFGVAQAKAALNMSRKHLVLFLELLDRLQITQRTGDGRMWLVSAIDTVFPQILCRSSNQK